MTNIQKIKRNGFFKNLALISIFVYIVCSTMFDSIKTGLANLSSFSLYFCLACCTLYLLSVNIFKVNYTAVVLILFGVTLSLSTLYTPADSSLISMYLYRYWTSAILVILISNVVTTQEDIEVVVTAFIVAGTGLSLFLYYTYGLTNLFSMGKRIDDSIANQNNIGIFCAFAVVFCVYKFVTIKTLSRMWYVAPMLVCLPAIMFSGSRKSILTIFVALLVFVSVYTRNKNVIIKLFWIVVALGAAFLIIYYVPAFELIRERILSLIDSLFGRSSGSADMSDNNRISFIFDGLIEFSKSPILGNGFFYSSSFFGTYSHNNYVELLMNGGIVSFFAYYAWHIGILTSLIRRRKTEEKKFLAFSAMVVIAILFDDIAMVSYFHRYFMLLLCICAAKMSQKN